MTKKKCPYCELGGEMSVNLDQGNIGIEYSNNKYVEQHYINACSVPDLSGNIYEFNSVAINYCPFCGRKFNDEGDKDAER